MANKYIIHGAALCGDGTTSDVAASAGAAGAWNDINVFTGTAPAYGALNAGDKVFIRSKTSAGADISVTIPASVAFGKTNATAASPITWVIDPGTVWAAVSGTITYTLAASTAEARVNKYNNIVANNYNFILLMTATNYGYNVIIEECFTKDIKIDYSSVTFNALKVYAAGVHVNLWYVAGAIYQAAITTAWDAYSATATFYNPNIHLRIPQTAYPIFAVLTSQTGMTINVYGGRAYGAGAVDGAPVCATTWFGGGVNLFGFEYPRGMKLALTSAAYQSSSFSSIGADGSLSSEYVDYYYSYSTRLDNYYPTLNAALETGGNWSYAIYPYRTNPQHPVAISTVKAFTQSAAIKTVTVNFLWPNSATISSAVPTTDEVYIVVQYKNTAGETITQTTLESAGANIPESSANWSSLTYGATLFKKYALSVTTLSQIAENSNITVTFFSSPVSGAMTDIIILDPDPVLT